MALLATRKLRNDEVLAMLAKLFITRGRPALIRSDNELESVAMAA